MVGIPSASNAATALAQLVRHARRDFASAPEALAAVALASARVHDQELLAADLRLFEHTSAKRALAVSEQMSDALVELKLAGITAPFVLGRLHELLLAETDRKVTGAHLTPSAIAEGVVATLDERWCEAGGIVLDPAVGGGAFLLAALDQMVQRGVEAAAALDLMCGIDINAEAVAVAETALVLWGIEQGVAPAPVAGLRQGDGLVGELPASSIVIGNPPFLSQLRSASSNMGARRALLRERWGGLVGAYTDEAWLFLAAGADALTDTGQLAMVQPLSVLAARHGAAIRRHVDAQCDLVGIWLSNGRVFDAAVEVCAVTLQHRADSPGGSAEPPSVRRWSGASFDQVESLEQPPADDEWGSAAAVIAGIPHVLMRTSTTIASLASATAGFRDQFYGFAPHVVEGPAVDSGDDSAHRAATHRPVAHRPVAHRLVTVGMIDPLLLRWGHTTFRFAKQQWLHPQVDREQLRAADPQLDEWIENRMKPKVLVATQTRVVEAWVDEHGDAIPATPVISLEPFNPDDCWHLAAALSSPPLSAHAASSAFGTALAVRALKLSARALLELPLPVDRSAWDRGARLARAASQLESRDERHAALVELGAVMASAYRISALDVEQWWQQLLPRR